jgi:hypothetical protein
MWRAWPSIKVDGGAARVLGQHGTLEISVVRWVLGGGRSARETRHRHRVQRGMERFCGHLPRKKYRSGCRRASHALQRGHVPNATELAGFARAVLVAMQPGGGRRHQGKQRNERHSGQHPQNALAIHRKPQSTQQWPRVSIRASNSVTFAASWPRRYNRLRSGLRGW